MKKDSLKLERLLSMILILSRRSRISTQTLAELLEVSPRTVSRYVESLCIAGVPVNTCCGVNGGIELEPGYSPERSLFTKGDLSRLITALSAASPI